MKNEASKRIVFFSFLFHGNSSCFADGFTHQVMHEKPYISNKNSVFHFSTDPTTATTILLYMTYTIRYRVCGIKSKTYEVSKLMKVTFSKDVLSGAVQPAMGAVSTKNTDIVISGIRLTAKEDGTCEINAFDLEKGIVCHIHGDVERPGSYIINGQKLSQIIRNMPGDITIDVNEKAQATISSGHSRFILNVLPGEDFPNMPMLEGDWGFEMEEWQLRDMLNKTVYAAAGDEEPRPALKGVFFHVENDRITTVATDSFRLAMAQAKADLHASSMQKNDLDCKVIVPAKTVTELMRLIGDTTDVLSIYATRKHIIFQKGELYFFSRLIDAEYIDYQKFFPKNIKSEVLVPRDALRDSLERASLVTEDRALGQAKSYVKCCFEGKYLDVSSNSSLSSVYDQIEMRSECEKMELGFSCRYLLDALRAADTEYVKISLISPLTSILISGVPQAEGEQNESQKEKTDKTEEKTRASFVFLVVPMRMV